MNSNVINYFIQRHEDVLEKILKSNNVPSDLIRSAMYYSLIPGGKRMRPMLVYLSGDLIGVDKKILDIIAASIELTHCYSLIHDDLPAMDNDDLRRGRPSCHKAYDEATAILVGDGLQALAIEILLRDLTPLLPAEQIIAITQELVKASGVNGMVSGQSLDLTELAKPTLSEQKLEEIHLLKTGKLISACFEMVLAAQSLVDESIKNALRTYAYHIGLVFQIQDDYLDYYAPTKLLGKSRSSDLANEKCTYATLFNKSQLEEKIEQHYQIATQALNLFGEKAFVFKEITQSLHNRSKIN